MSIDFPELWTAAGLSLRDERATLSVEDPRQLLSEPHWFVLYAMPQSERRVGHYLKKLTIEHYLPLVPKRRQWSDRIKIIEFPLFPGYIFVHINWFEKRHLVLQHSSALGFVRDRMVQGPAIMTQEDIDTMSLLVQSAEDIRSDPINNFPPGQRVRVETGPLRGAVGEVVRVQSRARICLRLPLLGQVVSASFDPLDLEVLS